MYEMLSYYIGLNLQRFNLHMIRIIRFSLQITTHKCPHSMQHSVQSSSFDNESFACKSIPFNFKTGK